MPAPEITPLKSLSSCSNSAFAPAPLPVIRYLPTTPLEFARPSGNFGDFESSKSRADSEPFADSTTAFAFWKCSRLSASKYVAPVTRPFLSTGISRTYLYGRISQFPVATARGSTVAAELERAPTWQPKPEHMPQFTQPVRPMYGWVMIASGPGTTVSPSFFAATSNKAPEALSGTGGTG